MVATGIGQDDHGVGGLDLVGDAGGIGDDHGDGRGDDFEGVVDRHARGDGAAVRHLVT